MTKELIVTYHLVGTVKIRDKILQLLVTLQKCGKRWGSGHSNNKKVTNKP